MPPILLVKPAAKFMFCYLCTKRITLPTKKKTAPPTKKPKRANLFFSNFSIVEKSLPSLSTIDSIFNSADAETLNAAIR